MTDTLSADRLARIKLLLMDCDGVLTDGRLYFSANGEELKVFHTRDGQGITDWHRAGGLSGIISGREAETIIRPRVDELGIAFLRTGSKDKVRDLKEVLAEAGVLADETAFIGDDIGDIAVMREVGLAVAVGDAHDATKRAAHHVTNSAGGLGAVREVTDLLLSARQGGSLQ